MASFTGICLTEEQIQAYVVKRDIMPTEEDSRPLILSDQKLLDSLLGPKQSVTFREKYPNIFL